MWSTVCERPHGPSSRSHETSASRIKILGLRVVHHNGVGGLFGHEHEILAQRHADRLRFEQLDDLRAVFKVRAGRIAEAVAAAAIVLLEQLANLRAVL